MQCVLHKPRHKQDNAHRQYVQHAAKCTKHNRLSQLFRINAIFPGHDMVGNLTRYDRHEPIDETIETVRTSSFGAREVDVCAMCE